MARTPEENVKATITFASDQASELSKQFLEDLRAGLEAKLKYQNEMVYEIAKEAYLTAGGQTNVKNPPNWSKDILNKAVNELAENAKALTKGSVDKKQRVAEARNLLSKAGVFNTTGANAKKADVTQEAPTHSTPRKVR